MIMYRILRLHTRDNKFKLSSVKYSSILFFYRLMVDDETTELGSIFHTLTSLFAKKKISLSVLNLLPMSLKPVFRVTGVELIVSP